MTVMGPGGSGKEAFLFCVQEKIYRYLVNAIVFSSFWTLGIIAIGGCKRTRRARYDSQFAADRDDVTHKSFLYSAGE